ncbi:hypothetical protein TRFO_03651 [Tritrichomonas foetus]|uniref:Uncharacterized protein n=1 Tax=Tritrichomonas foetus TaxID=1144522 RepID=A0A1J4KNW4_9EUKA|nr:hypothetical protein TRFO_03651 [Tritrichomonas foetus]|eukprot:OHT12616.1 hypothetical protein TRFO_03651 [Tritrichomonas foetus]
MNRPTQVAMPFSTKLIEQHLREMERSILDCEEDEDDQIFDEVEPKLNLNPKKQICRDLPPIEVKAPPPVQPIKRKPFNLKKKKTTPKIVDIEFQYDFVPVRLEAPPYEIPTDYGYDYMTEQLLDLAYQFSRLTIPEI